MTRCFRVFIINFDVPFRQKYTKPKQYNGGVGASLRYHVTRSLAHPLNLRSAPRPLHKVYTHARHSETIIEIHRIAEHSSLPTDNLTLDGFHGGEKFAHVTGTLAFEGENPAL